jgi:hypothetical protein
MEKEKSKALKKALKDLESIDKSLLDVTKIGKGEFKKKKAKIKYGKSKPYPQRSLSLEQRRKDMKRQQKYSDDD